MHTSSLRVSSTGAPTIQGGVRRVRARVGGYLLLARPTDTIFAVLGSVLGAGLAGIAVSQSEVVLAMALASGFLSAGSMMLNDWHDVAEDAINRPGRPIPSGSVPRSHALALAVALLIGGPFAARLAGPIPALVASLVALASVSYTLRLKCTVAVGNVLTALLSCYPLWSWLLLSSEPSTLYLTAMLAFFIGGIGKEIARTAGDVAGDRACQLRTFATAFGRRCAYRVGVALAYFALLLCWIPVGVVEAGPAYAGALLLSTVVAALCAVRFVWGEPSSSRRLIVLARSISVLMLVALAIDLALAAMGSSPAP